MDELLFQTDDLMCMNPGMSDGEIALAVGTWFGVGDSPESAMLLEFVREVRRVPPVHHICVFVTL